MNFIKRVAPDAIAIILFLVIAFAYFVTPISEGLVLGGHDTVASVGQGREQSAFHAETGEHSRWTNTLFSGMPTYQISPSYESSSALAKVEAVFRLGTTGAMSYIFLFLLGFYILLRAFNFRPWLAALGSILWTFSSYFFIIIAAGHIWKVMTLTFIPPTIAGLVLCYRGKLLMGGAVTAIFAALQIRSNHVQMSYYFLFLMAFIVIAYLVDAIRTKKLGTWTKATGVIIVAGILGIAANLPNLYHTYEYSKLSLRGPSELTPAEKDAANATDGGLDRDYITQWSYGVDETMTLLIPDFKGGGTGSIIDREGIQDMEAFDKFYQCAGQLQQALQQSGQEMSPPGVNQYWGEQPFTVGPVYVGAIVCFLFLLGLFVVRGPMKWALLAGTLLSFLFAWGHNDAWFTNFCIDHLPMYNKFRTPSSALVVAEFTMPLLAMLCLANLLRQPENLLGTKRGKIGLGVSLLLSAGVCLALWMAPALAGDCLSAQDRQVFASMVEPFGSEFVRTYKSAVSEMHQNILSASAGRSLLFILVGIALIGGYVRLATAERKNTGKISPAKGAALCIGLALVSLVDMWSINKQYLNDESFTDPEVLQNVKETDADKLVLQDKSDFRVMNISEGNPFNETSNHTAFFHQSIGGYNAAKLHRYQDVIDNKLGEEVQQFAGKISEVDGDMTQVAGDSIAPVINMLNTKYVIFGSRQEQVIENPYANGNGWFVGQLDFADNADAEMAALKKLDTKHAAVADKTFRSVLEGSPLDSGTVILKSRTANEVAYEISSPKGGVAVLSEIYYPGWKATIDGQETDIARVNYILRAIKVPAGKHEVVMSYKPQSITATESVAFAAIALILLALVASIVISIRKKKIPASKAQK